MSSITSGDTSTRKIKSILFMAPPVTAFFYPYLLKLFNMSVTTGGNASLPSAAMVLLLVFAVPAVGLFVFWRLGEEAEPSAGTILAKRIALLQIASPPLFVAAGVILYMLGDPIADTTFWLVLWLAATALSVRAVSLSDVRPAAPTAPVSPRLRVWHGGAAVALLVLFIALHLTNHLAGVWNEGAHRDLMAMFRFVYRTRLIEPIVVALFLFQVGSGLVLLKEYTRRPADAFRTFQIATGAFLVAFVLGHMDSVFIYARTFAGIPTDWAFATGAPTGLIRDAWNIRLLPHYALGVFFVLAHLVLGARIVALAHGTAGAVADRLAVIGIALAAGVAAIVMLGMSGVHLAG